MVGLLATGVTGAATDSGNHATARRDAAAHLRALNLPSAAVQGAAPREPARGLVRQCRAGCRLSDPRRHLPAGDRLRARPPTGRIQAVRHRGGREHHRRPNGGEPSFTCPPVRDVLGNRELQVSVTDAAGGAAHVLAVTQSDWIVQRPHGDFVPRGIREVDVTVTSSHGSSSSGHGVDVVNRPQIRRLVAIVNRMPRGHRGPPLIGGAFVRQAERILGTKL